MVFIIKEGRVIYRPKRCGNNNKDEDNSPKTLNDILTFTEDEIKKNESCIPVGIHS